MPVKPSDSEGEYFLKRELRRLREAQQAKTRDMAESEHEGLKQLHWMHCPKCGHDLHEIDYRSVKVDACFGCGGMFLDKGEAEKIGEHEEPGLLQKMITSFFSGDTAKE